VPAVVWVPLQRRADQLGREARVPLRWRSPAGAPRGLAPVVPLRPVPVALVDVDSFVSPAVRRLLEAG
jgi:hypothetical protein